MRYRFYTASVFTRQLFGGNQLAIFPDARGLDTALMQRIAQEFNLSETVFVFPPDGQVQTVRVGGASVMVAEGSMEIPLPNDSQEKANDNRRASP